MAWASRAARKISRWSPSQQAEIALEIGGVAFQIVPDAEFRAEEGAGQLGPLS